MSRGLVSSGILRGVGLVATVTRRITTQESQNFNYTVTEA